MSRLPFELLLALRYLRPKRTFVSVITLISVLGVTVGVMALIIVISVMSGFDHDLREKILGFRPHLTIVERDRPIQGYQALTSVISTNPQVRFVAPVVAAQVPIETSQGSLAAPYFSGLDAATQSQLSLVGTNVNGTTDVSERGAHYGLLIGVELARRIRLEVGDLVTVYSPEELKKARERQDKDKEHQQMPVPDEYEVRGIFDVGWYEYNNDYVFTSLEGAQKLFGLTNSVFGLVVMLKNPFQAAKVEAELERALGPRFEVTTWEQENRSLLGALVVEKNVMLVLGLITVAVASLCILSALITFVVQKTREIGMLKSLGASDLQVSGLFLSQSGFIGTSGVAVGLGLAVLLLTYRNEFLHLLRRTTGFEIFPVSIYGFDELPCLIAPPDVAIICGSALLICLLGGLIPAWRAGRLKPVEALRYE